MNVFLLTKDTLDTIRATTHLGNLVESDVTIYLDDPVKDAPSDWVRWREVFKEEDAKGNHSIVIQQWIEDLPNIVIEKYIVVRLKTDYLTALKEYRAQTEPTTFMAS